MSDRQTLSYLQHRFQQAGIRPEKGHGQNFLIDLNLVEFLVRSAEIGPRDVVLEVGTGTGSLTAMLAKDAAAVVTVEIDTRMHYLAGEQLDKLANVTMLCQDALRGKNRIDERVLDAVREKLAAGPDRQFKLVANLPYNIATPLIANLLAGTLVPASMTVTIQKELADRITAAPSTKDYSALTIWVQALADAKTLRTLPPEVFWPRPKVTSAIIHIVPDPAKRALLPDPAFFHEVVKGIFLHRRKFLRSALLSARPELDKPRVDVLLAFLGHGPTARAENLTIEQFRQLAAAVKGA